MNNNFVKNLRFLRKKLKISQEEVADYIGKKKSMISNYERGISEPALTEIIKLTELFKIDLHQIIETDIEVAGIGDGNREQESQSADQASQADIISAYEKMTDRQQKELEHLVKQLHDTRMELIEKHAEIDELVLQITQLQDRVNDLESNKNVG